MSEPTYPKCPMCGVSLKRNCVRTWVCGSYIHADGVLRQTSCCKNNQLNTANAQIAELEAKCAGLAEALESVLDPQNDVLLHDEHEKCLREVLAAGPDVAKMELRVVEKFLNGLVDECKKAAVADRVVCEDWQDYYYGMIEERLAEYRDRAKGEDGEGPGR